MNERTAQGRRGGRPEGAGPPPRASRWSWGVFGVVVCVLGSVAIGTGWMAAGWEGVGMAVGLLVFGMLLRAAPVLGAWWFRSRD